MELEEQTCFLLSGSFHSYSVQNKNKLKAMLGHVYDYQLLQLYSKEH